MFIVFARVSITDQRLDAQADPLVAARLGHLFGSSLNAGVAIGPQKTILPAPLPANRQGGTARAGKGLNHPCSSAREAEPARLVLAGLPGLGATGASTRRCRQMYHPLSQDGSSLKTEAERPPGQFLRRDLQRESGRKRQRAARSAKSRRSPEISPAGTPMTGSRILPVGRRV